MRISTYLIVCLLLTSSISLLPVQVHAQAFGYYPCVDDSGNAALCAGEIPEELIPEETYTRAPDESGCGSGSLSWTQDGNEEVPGVYWAFLKTYCRDNRTIVIWTDIRLSLFSGRTSNPFAKKCGRPYSSVPREEDWGIGGEIGNDPCITYDFSLHKSGEGSGDINGVEFNLSDGDVFLISTVGGEVTVRQIDYDLTSVSTEDIQLLARRYSEIRSFFEEYAR